MNSNQESLALPSIPYSPSIPTSLTLLLIAIIQLIYSLLPTYQYIGGRNQAGFPHGYGAAIWHNQDKPGHFALLSNCWYKGQWENGKKSGNGIMFHNGRTYCGQWRKNHLRYGTMTFKDYQNQGAGEYTGFFWMLNPDGKGKLTTENYVYDGQWVHGKQEGFGTENRQPLAYYEKGKRKNIKVITNRTTYGIDISHYQPIVQWSKMYVTVDENGNYNDTIEKQAAISPIQFVYIKATEGKQYHDPTYKKHTEWAERYGIKHGSYHYFNQHQATVKEQIKNFTGHVEPPKDSMTMPAALDIEQSGLSKDSLLIVAEAIKKHYGSVILYMNHWHATIYYDNTPLKHFPLWQARYGRKPKRNFSIHQFTETGTTAAIKKHHVDIDSLAIPSTK
ncbi:MAG: hypothetical protein HUK08_00990 [Bacteroidaceae bacterium]|nr:hypothetical protein [Bacteroidaceae bacterium]